MFKNLSSNHFFAFHRDCHCNHEAYIFLHKAYQSSSGGNTRQNLSSMLGRHFKQQHYQRKAQKDVKHVARNRPPTEHLFTVWAMKGEGRELPCSPQLGACAAGESNISLLCAYAQMSAKVLWTLILSYKEILPSANAESVNNEDWFP